MFCWYPHKRLRERELRVGLLLPVDCGIIFSFLGPRDFYYGDISEIYLEREGLSSLEAMLIARRTLCQFPNTVATAITIPISSDSELCPIPSYTFCSV
jgi:hypothetical protein